MGIKIRSGGRTHLGKVIGKNDNKNKYIDKKVEEWCKEIEILSIIAATESHAAFSGFIFCLKQHYTYFMRTIPNISQILKRLQELASGITLSKLYSMITICNEMERELKLNMVDLE